MANFPTFVNKPKTRIALENNFRYYLRVSIDHKLPTPKKKAMVIMKNPSEAVIDHQKKIYQSDRTVNKVLRYLEKKEYTEVTIVNLFARYYKDSENLNQFTDTPKQIVGEKNDKYIRRLLKWCSYSRIFVAWGVYPQKSDINMKQLYKKRIFFVEQILKGKVNICYVKRMVGRKLFPSHGLNWDKDAKTFKYRLKMNSK